MAATIEQTIKELLVERLFLDIAPSSIEENTPLSTYGIDSFLLLELIVVLEEVFDVQFEQGDITAESLRTVSSLAELVRGHQNQALA